MARLDALVGFSIITVSILIGINSCHVRNYLQKIDKDISNTNISISNCLSRIVYQTIATEDLNKRVAWRYSVENKEPGSSQTDYAGAKNIIIGD